jgi:hypothetical protein
MVTSKRISVAILLASSALAVSTALRRAGPTPGHPTKNWQWTTVDDHPGLIQFVDFHSLTIR